ncbi:MAG: hypothetical protein ACOYVK_12890 [Bacillota bacterium]
MKKQHIIAGVLIFLTLTMLGGITGMVVMYRVSANAEAEEMTAAKENVENQESTAITEKPETVISSDPVLQEEETNIETKVGITIESADMTSVETALETWEQILVDTSEGHISEKDASHLLYVLASEIYQRNIPEAYTVFRLKHALAAKKSQEVDLNEVKFSNIRYEGEQIAYADVVEIYSNYIEGYTLKLVKEKEQWCFAAQILD